MAVWDQSTTLSGHVGSKMSEGARASGTAFYVDWDEYFDKDKDGSKSMQTKDVDNKNIEHCRITKPKVLFFVFGKVVVDK